MSDGHCDWMFKDGMAGYNLFEAYGWAIFDLSVLGMLSVAD